MVRISSNFTVRPITDRIDQTNGEDARNQDTSDDLEVDKVFSILRNRRRRDVIKHLKRHDGELTQGDLAELIAAAENGKSVSELTSTERKRLYVSLYQCHLPMMAEAGVIDFDQRGGEVRLRERARQLEKYLGDTPAVETAWWNYYLGLAVVGGFFYAVGSLVFGPGDWLPVLAVSGTVLGTAVVALQERHRFQVSESFDPESTTGED